MTMRSKSEVLHRFAGILGSTEKKSIGSGRCPKSKLIQSQRLTTSLLNPSSGSGGKTKSSNREFRDRKKTIVISDRTDDNDRLALVRLADICYNPGEGNRWAVNTRREKPAENDLVEVGIGTA